MAARVRGSGNAPAPSVPRIGKPVARSLYGRTARAQPPRDGADGLRTRLRACAAVLRPPRVPPRMGALSRWQPRRNAHHCRHRLGVRPQAPGARRSRLLRLHRRRGGLQPQPVPDRHPARARVLPGLRPHGKGTGGAPWLPTGSRRGQRAAEGRIRPIPHGLPAARHPRGARRGQAPTRRRGAAVRGAGPPSLPPGRQRASRPRLPRGA